MGIPLGPGGIFLLDPSILHFRSTGFSIPRNIDKVKNVRTMNELNNISIFLGITQKSM